MRKLLLSLVTGFSILISHGQVTDAEATAARQLVAKNSAAIGLTTDDLNNIIVANTYKVPGRDDLRMVYLQQSYKGIPVFNEMQVISFRHDQLASLAGSRVSRMPDKVNVPEGIPALTSLDAVTRSLRDAGLEALEPIVPVSITGEGRKFEFGSLGVALENITAELMWLPTGETKKEVRLIWQVFLAPNNSSAYWLIRVDAMNGQILEKQNLTITCNWDPKGHSPEEHMEKHQAPAGTHLVNDRVAADNNRQFLVNSANYRVIPFPYESPSHLGAPSAVAVNPWQMAPGNATSLGWHNDGVNDHDSTRGNNVWAAEDRSATNAVINRAAVSLTALPDLNFDYNPDYTVAPTSTNPPNQQFAITNLFYWNNIMHDLSYVYGFDEASGNFQNNNQGRGGNGNDYVIADAQDGGSANNANFATPVDGSRPRMQMYLWTSPNPDRDGDLDNGIVAHEYTHGISNRLTGGPGNSSCLGNAEHGGEGWSDYLSLMVTTNWATATTGDGATPRGIGTYAANQPPTGSGIRNFRYSTNLAVNPLVYSANLPTSTHNRGEYWCAALWEMTWEIIQVAGINPNLYNPTAGGGNAIALKLVIEGMRLQPCSPGFIDARNAILKADTLFYGAQYSCAIWKAFAKRGMGKNASQGSSASVTDQVPSFIADNSIFSITQSAPTVQEGQNVTYTNKVTAGVCSPLVNAYITDTLPTHVTWVSGGNYNAANRTVTFGPINLSQGQTQNFSFTVSVNNGSYFTPVEPLNETVPNASIPATWTATSTSAASWTASSTQSHTPPNAFFGPDPSILTDHRLATTGSFTLQAGPSAYSTLSFWHMFNTEDGWDGGVVEISTNGGTSWIDLGPKMIQNRYNGSLGGGSGNILAGRQAFTGMQNSFMKTVADLSAYSGQAIMIRFRFTTDDNTAPAGGGWYVDDVVINSEPVVHIKSQLFNSSNVLLVVTDTITRILPNTSCTPVTVSAQPNPVTTCAGNAATYEVTVAGTTPISYQWQVNTGSGWVNISNAAPYSGTTVATLSVSAVTTGMNGYQYRCLLSNTCSNIITNAAGLTVEAVANVQTQPAGTEVCTGAPATFTVSATGATGYQWQVDNGSGFANISDGPDYSGTTTATLSVASAGAAMNGYQYRVVMTSCGPGLNSASATLTVSAPATVTSEPVSLNLCEGSAAQFSVTVAGSITGYQWQVSTDGGATFTNLAGQTQANLTFNSIATTQDGYQYRCAIAGVCETVYSQAATLGINPVPVFNTGILPPMMCVSDTAARLTATGDPGTWSGNGVQGSYFHPSQAGIGSAALLYTATNSYGCTASQSAIILVNECPERHVSLDRDNAILIYPNPNNGMFSIRIKTDLYSKLGLRVYASDGRLVATQVLTGLAYDRIVPIDLSRLSGGVYQLFLYNDEGTQLVRNSYGLVIVR